MAVATNQGFQVYTVKDFFSRSMRKFDGGVQIVQAIGKSQLFLLVPTGENSNYSNHSILLWDNKNEKVIQNINFNDRVRHMQ